MFINRKNSFFNSKYVTAKEAFEITENMSIDLYVGVPDSTLKDFISNITKEHIMCVNEAHSIGVAFGSILCGKKVCVYLQNSGLGNIINPLTSLCIPSKIYPFLVIGHRHTIEQHKVMGDIDDKILKLLNYDNYVFVKKD
jgi:phosphonopyruvate decarboxylase